MRGAAVISRIAAGLLVATLAGCANEPNASPYQQNMSHLGGLVLLPQDLGETSTDSAAMPRKSVASKVLSAMAFEKVTGLKADPARLLQTD